MTERGDALRDGYTDDGFGLSVGVDDETIVVGAYDEEPYGLFGDTSHSGSAYVFEQTGTGWEQTKLRNRYSDYGDRFGGYNAVGIDDGTVVIGARSGGSWASGLASVYERHDGEWTQQLLHPVGLGYFDAFGSTVAIDDGTIAVSAPRHKDPDGERRSTVYVFRRAG
ncbi:hypothetical protein [Haladaptatus sp. NG-SE-30]